MASCHVRLADSVGWC